MSSLERVVRPYQTTVGPARVIDSSPPAATATTTYGTTRTDGQTQSPNNPSANKNVLSGGFSLSATAYNKKYPKEKKSTGTGASNNTPPEPDPFLPISNW